MNKQAIVAQRATSKQSIPDFFRPLLPAGASIIGIFGSISSKAHYMKISYTLDGVKHRETFQMKGGALWETM